VALLNYQITDPVTAIINVRNWDQAIKLVCACLLRDAVGYNTFDTLQMDKKKIQNDIEVIKKYCLIIFYFRRNIFCFSIFKTDLAAITINW